MAGIGWKLKLVDEMAFRLLTREKCHISINRTDLVGFIFDVTLVGQIYWIPSRKLQYNILKNQNDCLTKELKTCSNIKKIKLLSNTFLKTP